MIESGIAMALKIIQSRNSMDALCATSGTEKKYNGRPNGIEIAFLKLMELLMEDLSSTKTLV